MDKFIKGAQKQLNFTVTENGATANKSTGNKIVDLFGQIGALRYRSESDIIDLFKKAFEEDALVATKMLFYARDIRGGLGERKTFRIILNWMAYNYPEIVKLNLENVIEFGRYDDLFVLFDTPVEIDMIRVIDAQFGEDLDADYPTLLAKWMPSENASSKKTKELAKRFHEALNLSPKQYRTILSSIRAKLNLIETQISSGEWASVDYSKIPSKAAMQYRKAFFKHDEARYTAYLEALKKPEENGVKVNAATLFPYDITRKIIDEGNWGYSYQSPKSSQFKELYNAQWKALPDYLGETFDDSLCMVDTSGSMTCDNCLPLSSALALGIYCAEHNKGRFHNYFMTFSESPELQELKADNLYDNINGIRSIVANTNIEAAFDLILDTAVSEKLAQSELPGRLIIISDMEFDQAQGYRRTANKKEVLFKTIEKKFETAGYTMPKLVFWNVAARNAQFPMTEEAGAQFVSGHSQAIFEAVLKGEFLSPIGLVLSVLNKERYNSVVVQ